jgi:hypothetical protein
VSFSSLFFWTSKRIMPRGERKQTEDQPNEIEDTCIRLLEEPSLLPTEE